MKKLTDSKYSPLNKLCHRVVMVIRLIFLNANPQWPVIILKSTLNCLLPGHLYQSVRQNAGVELSKSIS